MNPGFTLLCQISCISNLTFPKPLTRSRTNGWCTNYNTMESEVTQPNGSSHPSVIGNRRCCLKESCHQKKISGVHQGTVLGPLLFLTNINDLPGCVASSKTKLFADDSLLFRVVYSQQDADYLQIYLTALEKWEREWQMSFHPEKCTRIRMHATKKSVFNTTFTLYNHIERWPHKVLAKTCRHNDQQSQ